MFFRFIVYYIISKKITEWVTYVNNKVQFPKKKLKKKVVKSYLFGYESRLCYRLFFFKQVINDLLSANQLILITDQSILLN